MRIVLDTTNLVSSLIESRGPSAAIVDAWRQGRLTLISSNQQIDELRDVLSRPRIQKRVMPDEAARLVENVPTAAVMVEPTAEVRLSPDPKDNYIIGMAIAGNADRIVTGDKHHLQTLGTAAGIPIITARSLLLELAVQKEEGRGRQEPEQGHDPGRGR